jgi:putative tryptophan/tyrosine transport system substrate-binding protein
MRRRDFIITVIGSLSWPFIARAQQTGTRWTIGVLSPGAPNPSPPLEAFRSGLSELGYIEGQNVSIIWKFSGDRTDRLSVMADELVRAQVDVIFAINTPATLAAKNATAQIPIIMTRVSDPVRTGLVASLAHPGANLTGLTTMSEEVEGKRLQLLREALPGRTRLAVLWNEANRGHVQNLKEMQLAGARLGLEVFTLGVSRAEQVGSVFKMALSQRAEALFVVDDLFIQSLELVILEFASNHKLPVISQFREFAEAGGLMAYGPNNNEMFRRVAFFVDKIFKGIKPADLPVERPTKFELIINMKTAKALNLKIPVSVLDLADEVIE